MKKYLSILLAALIVAACHGAIWDKLNDHEARIARLEQLCNQMNTNIDALQAIVNAIAARDYVKEVVPVTENGLITGYHIVFNSSNPITIFNGKNGEDGHTPIIGIKKDGDNWYWTLDGEWILDGDGKKVRADAGAPRLKIEEDYWWVSYDNGSTWSKLDKAVGESGSGGDSMIQDIRQDDSYVYIILADGEELKIAKGGLHWVYVD